VWLFLHIFSAIVGFGTVFLNGLYGRQASQREGSAGLAIFRATESVAKVASLFIYAVFVSGILLVLSSDAWSFGDSWISAAMGLYIVAIGLSHGLLQPNVRKMGALMEELVDAGPPAGGAAGPPPQVAEIERRGRTVGMTSAVLNLMVVAILYLMIWKPG
jgi:uncharacterized membrane protein